MDWWGAIWDWANPDCNGQNFMSVLQWSARNLVDCCIVGKLSILSDIPGFKPRHKGILRQLQFSAVPFSCLRMTCLA